MSKTNNSQKILFFDESGNTEAGLKDPDQFFITFASVNATEEICKQAIKNAFPKSQAKEIKYTQVKNRKKQVIQALTYVRENGGSFKTYLVYKPLFLFHSLLTAFFENTAEHIGADHLSGNPDFTYYRMHDFWFYYICTRGSEFLASLILKYQNFAKNLDESAYKDLCLCCKAASDDGCSVSYYIYDALQRLGFDGSVELIKPNSELNSSWIDTVLPSTLQLLSHWGNELNVPVTVIHDDSLPLEKRTAIINILNKAEIAGLEAIESKDDPGTFWYPVPNISLNQEIQFCNSKDYYGLQIADVLAGAINECAIANIGDAPKATKKMCLGLSELLSHEGFLFMYPDITLTSAWFSEYITINDVEYFCCENFKRALLEE